MCCLLAATVGVLTASAGHAATAVNEPESKAKTVLILPFDMVDTSAQAELNHGPLKTDVARLRRTTDAFRQQVQQLAAFRVVDPADQVRASVDDARQTYRYLYQCNGCELDIGKRAGAELVMTGWVQKVSNLILNFNAVLRDVKTGKEVAGGSVSMRGDTDESWRHAAIYFANHTLIDSYRERPSASGTGDTAND